MQSGGVAPEPPENFRKIDVEIAHFLLVLPAQYHSKVAKQSSVCNLGVNFFQYMTGGGHSPMSPLWLRPRLPTDRPLLLRHCNLPERAMLKIKL